MFMNSERPTNDIPAKFIVVCDKFTEPIANSLSNRAAEKGIESVVWKEDDYESNKVRLKNLNHILFFNEKGINLHLADPTIKPQQISPGVLFKKQGHQAGIYIDRSIIPREITNSIAKSLKENWKFLVLEFLAAFLSWPAAVWGVIGGGIFYWFSGDKKARIYLLMKAVDQFDKDFLLDYVQD